MRNKIQQIHPQVYCYLFSRNYVNRFKKKIAFEQKAFNDFRVLIYDSHLRNSRKE